MLGIAFPSWGGTRHRDLYKKCDNTMHQVLSLDFYFQKNLRLNSLQREICGILAEISYYRYKLSIAFERISLTDTNFRHEASEFCNDISANGNQRQTRSLHLKHMCM